MTVFVLRLASEVKLPAHTTTKQSQEAKHDPGITE
jgi:hypothetical protein